MLSFMYNILYIHLKQGVENIEAQYCLTVFKLIEIMFKLKDICCKDHDIYFVQRSCTQGISLLQLSTEEMHNDKTSVDMPVHKE